MGSEIEQDLLSRSAASSRSSISSSVVSGSIRKINLSTWFLVSRPSLSVSRI